MLIGRCLCYQCLLAQDPSALSNCPGDRVLKTLRIVVLLFCCGWFATIGFVSCVVKEAPSIDALACTKKGECSDGYKCYVVPDQGALCLSNGDGLKPYDPSSAETVGEPKDEPQPEPVTDSGTEPTPEPAVEPTPEPVAEPAVEPTPEPTSEPASETHSGTESSSQDGSASENN